MSLRIGMRLFYQRPLHPITERLRPRQYRYRRRIFQPAQNWLPHFMSSAVGFESRGSGMESDGAGSYGMGSIGPSSYGGCTAVRESDLWSLSSIELKP